MAAGLVNRSFHIVDYCVFIASIIISLGIGVFFAWKGQNTNEKYFMGDRNLKVLPVALSLLVTFISASGLLGTPAEMYHFGTQYALYIFAAFFGVIMGAVLVVPVYYPLKLTSSTEYFSLRYKSRACRLTATLIGLLLTVFANGLGLFAPSVALEAVTGFPVWVSMLICGISVSIYTTIGGMKAVVWTDVFQSFVIFVGVVTIVVVGTVKVGGVAEVWRLNQEWGRIEFFNMNPDPTERATFWSVLVMMSFLFMSLGSAQQCVQRFSALPNQRHAKITMLLNAPGFLVFGVLTCAAGIVAFAYYAKKGCDPLISGAISNPNQILPYLVLDIIGYPGLPGLFVSCIYSAALSTLSSSLNAGAAIICEDLIKDCMKKASPATMANMSKFFVSLLGACSLAMGFAVQNIGGTFIQIGWSIMGSCVGPLVGMLFLGALNPKAGWKGALFGSWLGLGFSMWISMGAYTSGIHTMPLPSPSHNCTFPTLNTTHSLLSSQMIDPNSTDSWNGTSHEHSTIHHPAAEKSIISTLYSISYLYYPFIGIMIALIIGTITSFIPGLRHDGYVPDRYLFPFVRYFRAKICTRTPEEEAIERKYAEIDNYTIMNGIQDPLISEKNQNQSEKEYIVAMETAN